MEQLALVRTLEDAWRPLHTAEKTRAEYYIGAASRKIRRRWPDVDARIAAGPLSPGLAAEDVEDVVIQMILGIIDGAPNKRAKSWSEAAGPFNRSVTLEAGRVEYLAFEDWMVDIFEPRSRTAPIHSFPPSGRYEHAFIWPEEKE